MRKLILKSFLITLLIVPSIFVQAQEQQEDSMFRVIEKLQSDVSILSRIKISGYVQAQYQMADSAGAASFAGGNFDKGIDKRFTVRRGRLKVAYNTPLSQYVLQFDATESGMSVKDIYFKTTDPYIGAFSLTGGIFNRPFGYEIEYSSSVRESPERAMVFQTLFPGERDLGASLTIQPPKTSNYNFIKLDLGVFNGTGPKAKDFDNRKDFIGHLTLNKSYIQESLRIGLGASYYNGRVINGTKKVWTMSDKVFKVDSAAANVSAHSQRVFKGIEAQLAYVSPIGLSQLRAEYLWGKQSGSASSSKTPEAKPTTDTYVRDFAGYYVIFTQNIFQTKSQVVLKYDVYDPNTAISGAEIGASGSGTKAGDIKYATFGFGWVYRFDANLKLTAYYDVVSNEKTNISGYTKDLKDNVFTLRLQYKF
jgi:hypothetical protein